jgi:hypothetical protein
MLQNIIAILALIPALLEAIRAVEAAIPMSGQGKAKTAMILQIIEATNEGARSMLPLVEKAIAIVVATLNAVGIFKK